MLHRLSGSHLAFANEPGDLNCRFEVKLIHGLRPICSRPRGSRASSMPRGQLPPWQRRTNVWCRVTNPAQRAKRLRSGSAGNPARSGADRKMQESRAISGSPMLKALIIATVLLPTLAVAQRSQQTATETAQPMAPGGLRIGSRVVRGQHAHGVVSLVL